MNDIQDLMLSIINEITAENFRRYEFIENETVGNLLDSLDIMELEIRIYHVFKLELLDIITNDMTIKEVCDLIASKDYTIDEDEAERYDSYQR